MINYLYRCLLSTFSCVEKILLQITQPAPLRPDTLSHGRAGWMCFRFGACVQPNAVGRNWEVRALTETERERGTQGADLTIKESSIGWFIISWFITFIVDWWLVMMVDIEPFWEGDDFNHFNRSQSMMCWKNICTFLWDTHVWKSWAYPGDCMGHSGTTNGRFRGWHWSDSRLLDHQTGLVWLGSSTRPCLQFGTCRILWPSHPSTLNGQSKLRASRFDRSLASGSIMSFGMNTYSISLSAIPHLCWPQFSAFHALIQLWLVDPAGHPQIMVFLVMLWR